MTQHEKYLHQGVCHYLRAQYPYAIFTSESSGLRTGYYQAKQLKLLRSSAGLPDLIIIHPSRGYHGLCIELKISSPYTKKGKLRDNEHIMQQQSILNDLLERGYYATFGVGPDHTKAIIDWYFGATDIVPTLS